VLLLLTGFCLAAPLSAQAVTRNAPEAAASSSGIIQVDRRCGRHHHYVRGHRSTRDGRYIRGHCVRDRDD
jgi:hypothetical protein